MAYWQEFLCRSKEQEQRDKWISKPRVVVNKENETPNLRVDEESKCIAQARSTVVEESSRIAEESSEVVIEVDGICSGKDTDIENESEHQESSFQDVEF